MNLIKSSYEIWDQSSRFEGMLEHIERAGRVCYKSEGNIKYDECGNSLTAEPFVQKMIKSSHGAMLEHGTVYLAIPYDYVDVSCKLEISIVSDIVEKYKRNPHTKWHMRDDVFSRLAFITTNYRVLVENNWLGDLKYLCEPTEYHAKRITVRFVLPIGISREFCRHRVFSFAEQSTRYCNFSSDKFNNELTFIEDNWCDEELLRQIEYWYINSYLKPQEKRNLLPLCTKTELVMTGFVSDWKHFFELRCASNAHPQAKELAIPLHEEFIRRGWL